jgi:hypothetical protein
MICHIVRVTKKHNAAWYNDLIGFVFPVTQLVSSPKRKDDKKYWVVCEPVKTLPGGGFMPTTKLTSFLITKSSCIVMGSMRIKKEK